MENLIRLPESRSGSGSSDTAGDGSSRSSTSQASGGRPGGRAPKNFFFSRSELGQLLALYSSRVMAGEWRDYALDRMDDMAVFSIFRHTHERPLFTVSKIQKKGQRKPSFAVHAGPKRLKSSSSLLEALEVFDKLPRLVKG